MTEPTQLPPSDMVSRMVSVETRMTAAEQRLDRHDLKITTLERGDTQMLAKLAENDERWRHVQEQLSVVEQIRDIQKTMSNIGKLVAAGAKGIRWMLLTAALVSGIYMAIKTGDLGSLSTFIGQLMGMQ